jgi:RHS repeat-associated protein
VSSYGWNRLFQGREYLGLLDAYDFRARTLWPELGRFGQEDPLGTIDSANLYQGFLGRWTQVTDALGQKISVFHLSSGDRDTFLDSISRIVGLKIEWVGEDSNLVVKGGSSCSPFSCSATARGLFLDVLGDQERTVHVFNMTGRFADSPTGSNLVYMNFKAIEQIQVMKGPKEMFDVGMIFFHEMLHAYKSMNDPPCVRAGRRDEACVGQKGDVVKFMNDVERERGVPTRQRYGTLAKPDASGPFAGRFHIPFSGGAKAYLPAGMGRVQ